MRSTTYINTSLKFIQVTYHISLCINQWLISWFALNFGHIQTSVIAFCVSVRVSVHIIIFTCKQNNQRLYY